MTIFTRSQYMKVGMTKEEGAAAHRRYYAQFVNAATIANVVQAIGADTITGSTDVHFNDIPLSKWQRFSPHLPLAISFRSVEDYGTEAGYVCVAKEAARQYQERNKS